MGDRISWGWTIYKLQVLYFLFAYWMQPSDCLEYRLLRINDDVSCYLSCAYMCAGGPGWCHLSASATQCWSNPMWQAKIWWVQPRQSQSTIITRVYSWNTDTCWFVAPNWHMTHSSLVPRPHTHLASFPFSTWCCKECQRLEQCCFSMAIRVIV